MADAREIARRLEEIRKRADAATPGPWYWKHSYEMPDGEIHWELTNPVEDKKGRTIDASLVLETSHPTWLGQHCETLPNWEFIAHARSDIDFLLAALLAERERVWKQAIKTVEGVWRVRWYAQSTSDVELSLVKEMFAALKAVAAIREGSDG